MNQTTPPDDNVRAKEASAAESEDQARGDADSDVQATEEPTPPDEPIEPEPAAGLEGTGEGDGSSEPAEDVPDSAVPAPRGGRLLAVLALLIAILAAAGSGYLAWNFQLAADRSDSVRADLSGEIGRLATRSADLEEKLRGLEGERLSAQARTEELQGRDRELSGRVDQLEARTARLASRGPEPEAPDFRLAEVEYLLRIANRQATLARNPEPALAALMAADGLLGAMADPRLQGLRRQLADDILSLRSLPKPDVEGLALRLGSLSRRVETLPLAGQRNDESEAADTGADAGGWARLKSKIAGFFGSIFSVRPAAGSATPLLSPEEAFFLRRHLELELQAARIALLESDTPVYRASLASARRWAEEYFRTDDPGVRGFITALGELQARDIEVKIPDISGSLQALLAAGADANP